MRGVPEETVTDETDKPGGGRMVQTGAGGQMDWKTVRVCLMDGWRDTALDFSTLEVCTKIQSTTPRISPAQINGLVKL